MSKEIDGKGVDVKGKARRRRRSGLRVPSDNVPRRALPSEDAPEPPEPEDPRLAVSVAYAFGANGDNDGAAIEGDQDAVPERIDDTPSAASDAHSAPAIAAVLDPEAAARTTEPMDVAIPDSVEGSAPQEVEPESVSPEEIEAEEIEAEEIEPEEIEPEEIEAEELEAEEIEPEEIEPEEIEPEELEPEEIEPEEIEPEAIDDQPPAAAVSAAAPAGKGRNRDHYKTVEMPAVQLEALGLSPALGDSVDIAFDDDDEITYADATPPEPDPEPAPAPVSESLPTEPERHAALPAAPPEPAQIGPGEQPVAELTDGKAESGASQPAPVRRPRAATMALSEEDLEEVRAIAAAEGEELPELESIRAGLEEADLASTPPRAVADEAEEPVPIADSGDSGEIITDDLIEEVDPAQSGPVAADSPAAPAPEPDEQAAAEGGKRPPAPPKPPPAPSKPKGDVAKAAVAATTGKGRKRKGKPWFEEIFEEDYLRTLPFLTPQATQTEAQLVAESLELEPGQQVLDVGCGYGRHAMELAARGIHVVALDSSLPLLLRGADEAQRRGLDINFVHGDMRELSFESQFDGAYCLFSTFGYFDDETNKKTALNIARALKPGGRFVVEILNRDYIISDLPSRVWWEGDGCVVLEEVDFNYFSSRVVSNRSVVFDDGRQLEQEISLRAYSLHEFGKLLHAAGFRVLEISGGLATRGRFFGNQSRDIIVLAERRNALPT